MITYVFDRFRKVVPVAESAWVPRISGNTSGAARLLHHELVRAGG